ncbi:hypothetical protein GCM10007116_16790 [Sulfodiicoccus acidiphilus]|uniref:Uncharacterized protein n=1 Tax=Sulfodiicoccus acidiphilus TaxID=1670455 RepID=A0A830H281_9CREN|nr:hypothetical protein GCM10007116_16790 [Sulfodiicoccus acidiphilus]
MLGAQRKFTVGDYFPLSSNLTLVDSLSDFPNGPRGYTQVVVRLCEHSSPLANDDLNSGLRSGGILLFQGQEVEVGWM